MLWILPLCFVGVISFFSASANGMGLLSRSFFWLRRLAKALQQRTEKIDYRACACVCACVWHACALLDHGVRMDQRSEGYRS